jgi:hypothetical protein
VTVAAAASASATVGFGVAVRAGPYCRDQRDLPAPYRFGCACRKWFLEQLILEHRGEFGASGGDVADSAGARGGHVLSLRSRGPTDLAWDGNMRYPVPQDRGFSAFSRVFLARAQAAGTAPVYRYIPPVPSRRPSCCGCVGGTGPDGNARRICSSWARAAICWANSAVWMPWNRPSSQPTNWA